MDRKKTHNDFYDAQTEGNIFAPIFEFVDFLFNEEIPMAERFKVTPIYDKIKELNKSVSQNQRKLIINLQNIRHETGKKYIHSHTVRTTVISLIMGNNLKLPPHKQIELGVAALLHDIGMLFIPEENYVHERSLSEEEKNIIKNHPIIGHKLLDKYKFPHPVKMAVLEHHEREDGTGYPKKITGEDISLTGKIIAVACSYDAISSKRVYKKSLDPHTGILEIVKKKERFFSSAIQALVNSLSIYPIGLYVLLSDGTKGVVVDIDPIDPRYQSVQLLDKKTFDGKNIVRQTFFGLYIVRPLRKDEMSAFV